MMKKRLSKTIWYGSDVDSEGNPIVPPVAKDANDLEGLHHGELYLHQADDKMSLWARSAGDKVLCIGGGDDEGELLWELRQSADGRKYIWTGYNVVTQQGITMYADNGTLDLPSIYAGLRVDNSSIYWEDIKDEEGNVIDRVLKAKIGTGEGGSATLLGNLENVGAWANALAEEDRIMVQKKGSTTWTSLLLSEIKGTASFENVNESGEGNAYTSIEISEDKKTLTLNKGENFAKQTDYEALNTKVTDFLEGSDTDGIINKWRELESFLSNMEQSDKLATILSGKADKGTTLEDYGITDVYTKTEIDSTLENYVTVNGDEEITGEKNFTGGLMVNGSPIVYDKDKKYWKLTGDLLVTGGVTMFANEGTYSPSTIMDAITTDNVNLKVVNGVLTFVGETGGGVADSVDWENVDGKPSWIGSVKPSYTFSEIGSKPTTLSGYGITNAYNKTEANNLLGKKWTQDDTKISNWDTAFGWGDHSKQGYTTKTYVDGKFLPLDGGTVTGNLRLRTGSEYTSPFLYFGDSDEVYLKEATDRYLTIHADKGIILDSPLTTIDGIEIKKSADGVLYIDANLVVSGGITMYGTDGTTSSSIWDGAPIASTSVKGIASFDSEFFAVNNGKVTFIGETGGGASSWDDLEGKPSWIGSTKPSYTFSEIGSKPTTLSGYGITDAKISNGVITLGAKTITPLTAHQTIYNLTFQAGSFSAKTFDPNGAAQTVNIPTKTSHITNDSNFITSSYVDGKFVTIAGSEDVTGVHNFTNGLKVGGIKMSKSQSGVVFLEGNLVVSGAVTMYGTNSVTASTIMDGILVDDSTIIKDPTTKQLMINPDLELGGGGLDETALASYLSSWVGSSSIKNVGTITSGTWNGSKITNAYLANSAVTISGKSVSLGGSLSQADLRTALGLGSNAYTSTSYLPLTGGTLTGGLTISSGNLIISSTAGDTVTKKLYPTADNTYLLGQESRRWSDVRTVLINGYTPIHAGNIGSYNAGSATKATQDGNGDVISSTYLKKSGGTVTGNVIIDGGSATSSLVIKRSPSVIMFQNSSGTTLGYLGFSATDTPCMYTTGSVVRTLLHSSNYNNYAPKLDGTGASGTWGISISGNASTATKLATPRTLWGLSFDGTKNVSGDMSGVGVINSFIKPTLGTSSVAYLHITNFTSTQYDGVHIYVANQDNSNTSRPLVLQNGYGNVGIGTTTPSYKVHVNGTTGFGGHVYLTGANSSSSTGNTSQILFGTSSSHHLALSSNSRALMINPTSSSTTGQIMLGVDGNRSYFTSSGYFGIGTSDPSSKLHVVGSVTASALYFGSAYQKSISSAGWYRFAISKTANSVGGTYLFFIRRSYSNSNNEAYIISCIVDYGKVHWSLLNGHANTRLITQVRCTYTNSGAIYFDLYYNGTVRNTVYVSAVGDCTLQVPTATTSTLTSTSTFGLGDGMIVDGNLLVKGGITMYATSSESPITDFYTSRLVLTETENSGAFNDKGIMFGSDGKARIGINSRNDVGIYVGGRLFLCPNSLSAASNVGMCLETTGDACLSGGLTIGANVVNGTYKLYVTGNAYVTETLTQGSDIRYKDIHKDIILSLATMAEAPSIEFHFKDDEQKSTHIGTSAQYWQSVSGVVTEDSEGRLGMDYSSLGVVMGISLAKELSRFESDTDRRIRLLEEENKKLKEEIEQLKTA